MAKRLYSLFELQNGKWVRISGLAFIKSAAVRHFQNGLLAFALGQAKFERSLRVVPGKG